MVTNLEASAGGGLRSYGKVYSVGHAAVRGIFDYPVLVEEKVDGSQFSMGVRNGQLHCRSRNVALDVSDGADNGMFDAAVMTAKAVAPHMVEGWTYRGEYLRSPKHNTLTYSRAPIRHFALFDVDKGDQSYVEWDEKREIAESLGVEVVPQVHRGLIEGPAHIAELMDRMSFLGGSKVEGLVFKAYGRFLKDGKTMMAKHVSEAFKETHRGDWRKRNPPSGDIKDQVIAHFRTPARWEKAIQHLRDDGSLQNAPQDIGPLMVELERDFKTECLDELADLLVKWCLKDVVRGIRQGFPEWYKERLLESSFRDASNVIVCSRDGYSYLTADGSMLTFVKDPGDSEERRCGLDDVIRAKAVQHGAYRLEPGALFAVDRGNADGTLSRSTLREHLVEDHGLSKRAARLIESHPETFPPKALMRAHEVRVFIPSSSDHTLCVIVDGEPMGQVSWE